VDWCPSGFLSGSGLTPLLPSLNYGKIYTLHLNPVC
jgi:hypothetical protein